MKTVHEVSKISGVSVRTLHHYDAIGLLPPTTVTPAGYRLYDDTALERLQSILLFRELEFPLKEIKRILDSPNFDKKSALKQQIELLTLREKQIRKLIKLARDTMNSGVNIMNFSAFDKTEIEQYAAEAKKKWGETDAYREYERNSKNQSAEEKKSAADKLMNKFGAMGKLKKLSPDSIEARSAIKDLQNFITENFYKCTNEILAGLGQMYVSDERFKQNIDAAGGDGTAEFVSKAIEFYCK